MANAKPMITRIQKWGNSLGLPIPKALAEDVHLAEGVQVDVSVENGRIVVVPIRKSDYDLNMLLDQVTPENVHEEVDFGRAVSREDLDIRKLR